jgi:hypothetical protein
MVRFERRARWAARHAMAGPALPPPIRAPTAARTDPAERLKQVMTFRESIEIVHTTDYENFLRNLFPELARALTEGQPQFVDGDQQRIRSILLEIFNRLPNNDVSTPPGHPLGPAARTPLGVRSARRLGQQLRSPCWRRSCETTRAR